MNAPLNRSSWIIWYAVLLHWIWGATLLSTPLPLGVTAISTIVKIGLVNGSSAGIFYLLVAAAAAIGTFAPCPINILFLLPQSGVLWLAAYGALNAILSGQYADGTIRSTAFLLTDQAPSLLAAFFHTLAVAGLFKETPKT